MNRFAAPSLFFLLATACFSAPTDVTGTGQSSSGGQVSSAGGTSSGNPSGASTGSGAVTSNPDCVDMSTTSGTVTDRYGGATLAAASGKTYYLQANWWQTFASEAEDYDGLSLTVRNPQDASVPSTNGSPMGFPSIFIGSYGGHTTAGSNLPKQVSALTSVPTNYQTNNSAIGTRNHNATYDVWFTAANTPLGASAASPGAGGAYLMVWMFKPTDRQPRGSDSGHLAHSVPGVSGTWNVWVDNSTGQPPCVSYVSTTPIDGLAFDLNDFIQDAVKNQLVVTSGMYLSVVFGGFEIWGAADGIQLKQFCATVN
jgi:hypothetical protein